MLSFAPENKIKISYASSFGIENIPNNIGNIYKKYLLRYDSISCREHSGVDIVKKLIKKNATHVVDPTLLVKVEAWKKVAIYPEFTFKYLLLYELTKSHYITKIAKKIAKQYNLKIVRICKSAAKENFDNSIINITTAGPSHFIGLFLNSSFVVTNSFHGTTFSVLFKKPFLTILSKHKTNNIRQISFLNSIDLSSQIVHENTFLDQNFNINYRKSHNLLKNLITTSENFLHNNINKYE